MTPDAKLMSGILLITGPRFCTVGFLLLTSLMRAAPAGTA